MSTVQIKDNDLKTSKLLRFRNIYMVLGSFLVIFLWLLTDPDSGIIQSLPFGASTIALIIITLKSFLYVAVLHLSRKALFDYPEADFQKLAKRALGSPQGAGSFAVAMSLVMIAISILILAAVSN